MLEFIIALLLSLGFNIQNDTKLPEIDAATMEIIRADGMYNELGGDKEFDALFKSSSSNPEDNIVIGVDPNPVQAEEEGHS